MREANVWNLGNTKIKNATYTELLMYPVRHLTVEIPEHNVLQQTASVVSRMLQAHAATLICVTLEVITGKAETSLRLKVKERAGLHETVGIYTGRA